MSQPAITSTTQEFLDIYDITNDMVFMKDGSAAAILLVSAMNFSLLAEEEQDAVIYAYAALLNSLNFQIQINIQSKTKDATAYLELLKVQEDEAASPDKKRRIGRYREFVGELIQERNVLDKKFYVVIPAQPVELGIITPQSILPGGAKLDVSTIDKNILLEKAAGILQPRVDHLIGQFNRIGLYARRFATQEIIQNYYVNYNPEAVEGQQITDTNDYTTPLVQASVFGASVKNRQQVIQQFTHDLAEAEKGALKTPDNQLTLQQPKKEAAAENPSEEIAPETPVLPSVTPDPEPQTNNIETTESPLEPTPEVAAEIRTEPSVIQANVFSTATTTQTAPALPQTNQNSYSLPPVAEIK